MSVHFFIAIGKLSRESAFVDDSNELGNGPSTSEERKATRGG